MPATSFIGVRSRTSSCSDALDDAERHEEWRDVQGWPYQVSNLGNVRRGDFVLKPSWATGGYLRVTLEEAPRRLGRKVHQLVAQAFIGDLGPGLVVNHLDGVKTNNRVSNLEITSRAGNCAHAAEHGLVARGERVGLAKLTEADVVAIRQDPRPLRVIGRDYGVAGPTILNVKRGTTWKHV